MFQGGLTMRHKRKLIGVARRVFREKKGWITNDRKSVRDTAVTTVESSCRDRVQLSESWVKLYSKVQTREKSEPNGPDRRMMDGRMAVTVGYICSEDQAKLQPLSQSGILCLLFPWVPHRVIGWQVGEGVTITVLGVFLLMQSRWGCLNLPSIWSIQYVLGPRFPDVTLIFAWSSHWLS